ncbi:Hypothetical predicted protein [Octopus vulgaris]|uniref:Uncharacterized protein n=1 Tax=Octopus vulgaris TaxID=6645 RepID=A0AA36ATG6_OCTVU|nr:Hypothetical predicted protein [Octopus vulgaris]
MTVTMEKPSKMDEDVLKTKIKENSNIMTRELAEELEVSKSLSYHFALLQHQKFLVVSHCYLSVILLLSTYIVYVRSIDLCVQPKEVTFNHLKYTISIITAVFFEHWTKYLVVFSYGEREWHSG